MIATMKHDAASQPLREPRLGVFHLLDTTDTFQLCPSSLPLSFILEHCPHHVSSTMTHLPHPHEVDDAINEKVDEVPTAHFPASRASRPATPMVANTPNNTLNTTSPPQPVNTGITLTSSAQNRHLQFRHDTSTADVPASHPLEPEADRAMRHSLVSLSRQTMRRG